MEKAIATFRRYLDELGFVRFYKYAVGANQYFLSPFLVTSRSRDAACDFASYVGGERTHLALLPCLMTDHSVPEEVLDARQREVADALVSVGLLGRTEGRVHNAGYQLISLGGMPLFIDARINFRRGEMHEVYIGVDSYFLIFYIDTHGLDRSARALDLCTGSGAIGLFLSDYVEHVTVTDIAPAPLRLVHVNRLLAGRSERVEVRRESMEETFTRAERYQVVTCNPPFVAIPEGLAAPIYAKGPDADGQGYLRQLFARLDELLTEDGAAYFVSDLLGDEHQPYFLGELEGYAKAQRLEIDVLIDGRLERSQDDPQIKALAGYLTKANPGRTPREVRERVEEMYRDTLRARCNYLSVMVTHRARGVAPSVRVLNRFQSASTPAKPSPGSGGRPTAARP